MRTRALLAAATATTLTLAGCGGGEPTDGGTIEDQAGAPSELDQGDAGLLESGDQETTTSDPGDASPDVTSTGAGPTVVVEAISFPDEAVTVEAGTPVTFVNRDSVDHTVTAGEPDDPSEPSSGTFDEDLPAGEQVTITVEEPGTYPYFCEIHQGMTGELVVEAGT